MAKTAQRYLEVNPWAIEEIGFHPEFSRVSEALFSVSNEVFGVRGSFEEGYSGSTLQGAYFNGIFEECPIFHEVPMRGMAMRFHHIINGVDWLHTRIRLGRETLDLATSRFTDFRRRLDLRTGLLTRSFVWTAKDGRKLRLTFERFTSMAVGSLGAQRILFEPLNFSGTVSVEMGLDFDTLQETKGRNYWPHVRTRAASTYLAALGRTAASGHRICSCLRLASDGPLTTRRVAGPKYIGYRLALAVKEGETRRLDRLVVQTTEKNATVPDAAVWKRALAAAREHGRISYDAARDAHAAYWKRVWEDLDVRIEGDPQTEQGLRFCIFHLHQAYHGVDPDLNVSAKGLTGEEYGGHAWWDTETHCLPFYLFNNPAAARNLLGFRYRRLQQAIDRAREMDCEGARYPLSTMDGTDASLAWERGDLEIHVSAGVAFGIWHYVRVTNDQEFLYSEGIEMLLQISRFYASQGQWGQRTGQYGFWGVVGPDEFQLFVHNNCYTNVMAKKAFEYTLEVVDEMKRKAPARLAEVTRKVKLRKDEFATWRLMARKMRIPQDTKTGVYEQHDGYFDLPHLDLKKIGPEEFPLYKNWCYYRILRWDMIKQPDVLLLHFLYSHDYSLENKRANFEFYEPRCIHESSLSPGIHSILAAELGLHEKAYDFWAHTARLDLDNFNRNTHEGVHTTSMASAWLNLVYGFGGMRSDGERLSFQPSLPRQWKSFGFRLLYRDSVLQIGVEPKTFTCRVVRGPSVTVDVFGQTRRVTADGIAVPMPTARRHRRQGGEGKTHAAQR